MHKYCKFIQSNDGDQSNLLNSKDIQNLILHLADFKYIREEFNTLYDVLQAQES